MLEHADRPAAIEALIEVAVVLQADLDRQSGAKLAGKPRLLLRDRDADAAHVVMRRRIVQRLAPATADVEHAHARRKAELAADEVELGFLRGVQVAGLFPVAATVG